MTTNLQLEFIKLAGYSPIRSSWLKMVTFTECDK
eukprot:gene7354-16992_t